MYHVSCDINNKVEEKWKRRAVLTEVFISLKKTVITIHVLFKPYGNHKENTYRIYTKGNEEKIWKSFYKRNKTNKNYQKLPKD